MMLFKKYISFLLLTLTPVMLVTTGCGIQSQAGENNTLAKAPSRDAFGAYWYAGEAEISSYELSQSRYGSNHPGEAVLIFVTEDFSKKDQVKLDYPAQNQSDVVKVMKLNYMKKFATGIYAYSVMKSVFTPIDLQSHPNTMKVSTTLQDWCGHSFFQLNLENNNYKAHQFSYFQAEGDKTEKLDKAFLEDEIWTRVRLNPASLPTGNIEMIPSSFDAKLRHYNHDKQQVEASLSEASGNQVYTVNYKKMNRKLAITFQKEFPHKILAWEEDLGNNGKTSAKLKKTINTDYWTKNSPQHLPLRDSLQLSF